MSNGKYSKHKGVATKAMIMILAVMLIVGCTIGGTLAWLTAQTGPVVNTFTYGDINIELDESDNLDLKMVPGCTITKDPKATVVSGSEDCYLFIEVVEDKGVVTYTPAGKTIPVTTQWSDFLSYKIADGWEELTNATSGGKVYYRVFDSKGNQNTNVMGTAYPILKDNEVNVNASVTKEMMNALTEDTKPTLTFTAYAVQLYKNNTEKFSPADAWAKVSPPITTP